MSFDGHLHEKDARRIIRIMTVPYLSVAIATLFWRDAWLCSIGLLIGMWGGYAITPDADHTAMTREEYRAMKHWGLPGAILVAYMMPYAYIFPHRSRWSHSIFPGTLIRIAYVSVIPTLLLIALLNWIDIGMFPYWLYGGLIIAWSIQDMFHYIRDEIGPLGTNRKRKVRW